MQAGAEAGVRSGEGGAGQRVVRGRLLPTPRGVPVELQQQRDDAGGGRRALQHRAAAEDVHPHLHTAERTGLRHRHVLGQERRGQTEGPVRVPHHRSR